MVAMRLRGINPTEVCIDEASLLGSVLAQKRNVEGADDTDAQIHRFALEPDASYSIMLKRLRLLRVDGRDNDARLWARVIAGRYPDAATQLFSEVCAAQHEEVLQCLKT